ncbi:MAG: LytTR family transcriptional regulator [Leadbetterella sp.]|nr:LytTR family transcriptional regulator [Leadbetterella sp.]
MNRICKYLRQPHPGYSDLRIYFRTIAGIALLVFLILSILQPFNLGQRNINGNPYLTAFVYAGSALLTMFAGTLWIVWLPGWFSEKNWTLRSELLIIVYQMSSIAVTVWIINRLRGVMLPDTGSYFRTLLIVFSTGILPYALITFVRHNYLLRKNLRKAEEITRELRSEIRSSHREWLEVPGLKERVSVNELYYAEADGNYLTLVCVKDGETHSYLCRCTMSELEAICSPFAHLFRCHRSFLVNLHKVLKVEGNAGGYFLHLTRGLATIPVSRTYITSFRDRLKQPE